MCSYISYSKSINYINIIGNSKRNKYQFYAYNYKKNNWKNVYITHQGNTNDTCENILEMELNRIYEYTKKGDIKSFKTIIEYLNKNNNL